jgi:hypothetical protein
MDTAKTVSGFASWVPFFSELIWPLFFGILVFVFQKQIGTAYKEIINAIKEGRAVKFGNWIAIGERTTIGQLVGKKQDLEHRTYELTAIDMSQNEEDVVKGSAQKLSQIQERVRLNPGMRITVLSITNNVSFYTEMLKKYISTLGVRYVVFKNYGKFDGWIEASTFVAQLPPNTAFSYQQLKSHINGIVMDKIPVNENAIKILKKMEEKNLDSLAVLENEKFLFMVSRGLILSKLMTRSLVEPSDSES